MDEGLLSFMADLWPFLPLGYTAFSPRFAAGTFFDKCISPASTIDRDPLCKKIRGKGDSPMAYVYIGDKSKVDAEVLEAVKSLPDEFYVFAEFAVGQRNID